MKNRREYIKGWKEAHKDYEKAKKKAWREAHKDYVKTKKKVWYESNRVYEIEKVKIYYQTHKEENKAWREAHKEQINEYTKTYHKTDLNSLGESKNNIRSKSRYYISKYGKKIPGYQIHHCCTYDEPYKFIYCSRQMHRLIHAYLRQHNIDADTDHYEYIKHLLDDTVIKYNIE